MQSCLQGGRGRERERGREGEREGGKEREREREREGGGREGGREKERERERERERIFTSGAKKKLQKATVGLRRTMLFAVVDQAIKMSLHVMLSGILGQSLS